MIKTGANIKKPGAYIKKPGANIKKSGVNIRKPGVNIISSGCRCEKKELGCAGRSPNLHQRGIKAAQAEPHCGGEADRGKERETWKSG